MADKPKYVLVNASVKKAFNKKLEAPLEKLMTDVANATIEKKGGGKLSSKKKSKDGYAVSLELALLADDDTKPTKLEAKLKVVSMGLGDRNKAFTGASGGKADGFGDKPALAAKDLVEALVESLMEKAVSTMKSL